MTRISTSVWRSTLCAGGVVALGLAMWPLGPHHREEALAAHSVDPVAASQPVAFGTVRHLPSADSCATSVAFNPSRFELDEVQMAALDSAILAFNQRLSELESHKRALAHEWAQQRLEVGAYRHFDERGKAKLGGRGRIAIAVGAVGEPAKLVSIGPGEYAALDVAAADLYEFASKANNAVARYFASHGDPRHLQLE